MPRLKLIADGPAGTKMGEPHPSMVGLGGDATAITPGKVGNMSMKLTPVSATSAFGFSMMNVIVTASPAIIVSGTKLLTIVGGRIAVSVALARPLALELVPVCAVEMKLLTLGCGPAVVGMTFTCTVHEIDARVGGGFRMSFRNFSTGESHSFGGEYLELVPDERIRYNDRFDDPNLPGEIQVTVTLKKVSVGTELNIEQIGIPDVIPVEACYLGWQDSLRNLASLVEPEINE